MNRHLSPTLLLSLLVLILAPAPWLPAQTLITSSTTIASPQEQPVHILSPSTPPTTVTVQNPALFLRNLEVFDNSILNFQDGLVSGDLLAHESATVNIHDGHFDNDVITTGSSTLNITNGNFEDLLLAENFSTINIRGGDFDAVKASHDSRIFITGGEIDLGLVTEHAASIFITGSNFNHPFGPLTLPFGQLTGLLADGTPINASFNINGGSITLLPVPEPTQLLLFTLASLTLLPRRRPR
jgi:hypothetical protein